MMLDAIKCMGKYIILCNNIFYEGDLWALTTRAMFRNRQMPGFMFLGS